MSIETELNYTYIKGKDAQTAYKNAQAAQRAGNATTERGTLIKKSNTEFDKNSFLKILSAQLSHQDPTQNQDSSAYVTQMAQFTSMEQMSNLNTTMSDYAHQQMIGKQVILNEKNDAGKYITGTVTEVMRKSGNTYYTVSVNGKKLEIESKNIIGAKESDDYNLLTNNRTALNSDFLAASALASKNQNILVADQDENKKDIIVKGKVSGAYIDTITGATVKIKVDVTGTDGTTTTKTYNYSDIVSAGDLTDSEMNAIIDKYNVAQLTNEAEDAADAAKVAVEAAKKAAEVAAKAKAEAEAEAIARPGTQAAIEAADAAVIAESAAKKAKDAADAAQAVAKAKAEELEAAKAKMVIQTTAEAGV